VSVRVVLEAHSRTASRITGLYCVDSRTDSREEAREWCKFVMGSTITQLSIDILKPGYMIEIIGPRLQ